MRHQREPYPIRMTNDNNKTDGSSDSPDKSSALSDITEELIRDMEEEDTTVDSPEYTLAFESVKASPLGDDSIQKIENKEQTDDEHIFPNYADYLRSYEFCSGDYHCVEIALKNNGDKVFPGGTITSLSISSGISSTQYDYSFSVPKIDLDERKAFNIHFRVDKSGELLFELPIEADDGGKVCIIEGGDCSSIRFGGRGVDRESLLIIDGIKSIRENQKS